MVSRALLCRYAASLFRWPPRPAHALRRPKQKIFIECRWSTAVAALPATDNILGNIAHYNSPVVQNGLSSQKPKQWIFGDMEHKIWSYIQNGNIHNAIALSQQVLKQKSAREGPYLSPLTRFSLTKRRFQIECLLVGVYVALRQINSSRILQPSELALVFAALLADGNSELIRMYCEITEERLDIANTVFLASTAFHYLQRGKYNYARQIARELPLETWSLINSFKEAPSKVCPLIPSGLEQNIRAVWMLRQPAGTSGDVNAACTIVTDLARMGLVPDHQVLERLISFSISQNKLNAALPIYASQWNPQGFSGPVLVDLATARAHLARSCPRIHYDILCSCVRTDSLKGALAVATGVRSRHLFYLLLSQWAFRHPGDWKGVSGIVNTMLDVQDCTFLHSMQHLVVKSVLGALMHSKEGDHTTDILNTALGLHWKLLPRLESLSMAAIHQLIQSLIGHGMAGSAFQIYRELERRSEWNVLKNSIATDAIFAALVKGLAHKGDIRSIMHLASAITRRGIRMTSHFYTALICGLFHRLKRRRSSHINDRGRCPSAVLERVQLAESILGAVHQSKIYCSPKAYHAVMYGWALLGHPKKVNRYFSMLSSQKLFKSRLPENLSAISEVSWGILMYSYVRARDAKGALHVLNRARAWLQNQPALDSKTCTPANRCYNKSSHLVNMAMSILVDCKDSTGALSLLDTYIARYAEAQESSSPLLMQNELPATPADPITLNLVLRALLLNNQLQHAVTVYDTIHSHFGHIGAPAELKLLLQYCIAKHDSRSAFPIIKRILQLKGTLTSAELLHLIRICVDDAKPEPVVYLYDQLCVSDDGSIDKGSRLVKLMKSRTSIARCIFWALRENGREADAVAIEVMLDRLQNRSTDCAATSLPLLSNATVAHTKHQCVSLYRRFLHEINVFPHTNLRKKLRYNVRFVFELYRDLKPSDPLALQLIADGRRQLKWLSSWHNDPEAGQSLIHKSPEANSKKAEHTR